MNKIRNLINTFKEQHVILFSIISILCTDLMTKGIALCLHALGVPSPYQNSDFMFFEIIFLVPVLLILYLSRQQHIFQCGTKGLLKGLWSGMVFWILAVMGCSLSVLTQPPSIQYKSVIQIVFFILFVLLVGLAEELLFRGIIADCIFKHYGKSTFGIWISVILGGIIFGFAHVSNIFSGQSVEQTIIQMISLSMTGILFTAIYIRHRNIYAPIILHAVLDFFTMFEEGFFANGTIAPTPVEIDFWPTLRQSLISQSLFLIVAIFILRPKILRKIAAEKNMQ